MVVLPLLLPPWNASLCNLSNPFQDVIWTGIYDYQWREESTARRVNEQEHLDEASIGPEGWRDATIGDTDAPGHGLFLREWVHFGCRSNPSAS